MAFKTYDNCKNFMLNHCQNLIHFSETNYHV